MMQLYSNLQPSVFNQQYESDSLTFVSRTFGLSGLVLLKGCNELLEEEGTDAECPYCKTAGKQSECNVYKWPKSCKE